MSIDDEVDKYFEARQKIFEHVKYHERWRDFPLEDSRNSYWAIADNTVKFSPDHKALVYWLTHDDHDYGEYADKLFENVISDHAGESGVYRGAELTAIVADTQTDGNVFLQIFRNTHEIKLCACGAIAQYLAEDAVKRCRACMRDRQVTLHRMTQLKNGNGNKLS